MENTDKQRYSKLKSTKQWRLRNPARMKELQAKYHRIRMQHDRGSILLSQARTRAKRLNVKFDLTITWVNNAIYKRKTCAVSGLTFVLARANKQRHHLAPSIDRINPKGGYTKRNCRIVCWFFNAAFNIYGETVFKQMIEAYRGFNAKH